MARDETRDQLDYRAIVESVPAIVVIAAAGDAGRWLYVNEWVETILGFTVEEWMADPGIWVRQLHPDDRELAVADAQTGRERSARGRGDGGPVRDSRSFFLDYRMLHKDGHVVWVRDSSMLVRDAKGEPLWHGVMFDISDQKATEASSSGSPPGRPRWRAWVSTRSNGSRSKTCSRRRATRSRKS